MAKSGLGRGLLALMPEEDDQALSIGTKEGSGTDGILTVSLNKIRPNPNQPRKSFNEDSLNELSLSIKRHGIIQPILVEKEMGQELYNIVAGERRYRASIKAGLTEVPIIVRSFTHEKRLEIAIIENIQREDLNPIEEALGYRSLMELTQSTQDDIAVRVSKNRSTIANALRLLKLPEDIIESIRQNEITAGHARSILSVVNPADQRILFERMKETGMSVREAEKAAQDFNRGIRGKSEPKKEVILHTKSPEIRELEQRFIDMLGTKVSIANNGQKGTITIEYYSDEDLERLMRLLEKKID